MVTFVKLTLGAEHRAPHARLLAWIGMRTQKRRVLIAESATGMDLMRALAELYEALLDSPYDVIDTQTLHGSNGETDVFVFIDTRGRNQDKAQRDIGYRWWMAGEQTFDELAPSF